MTIHQSDICWTLLVLKEGSDLRTTRVNISPLHKKFLGNLLIRDNDEGLAESLRLVNRSMYVCPLLELQPHGKPGQVVNTAYDRVLLGARELGCW